MRHLPLVILIALLPSGCAPPDNPDDTEGGAVSVEPPSLWVPLDDARVVSLPDDEMDEQLDRATDEAHVAAVDAREIWRAAPPEERPRWAIKWAAPTGDDRIEQVWVCPVAWSEHRIEGVLANPPQNELACAKSMGELVSFPAQEMTDWIHFLTDDLSGEFEGGFTVRILITRYGRPSPAQ